MSAVPARDILSEVKGWNERNGTIIIDLQDLQYKVATKRSVIDRV